MVEPQELVAVDRLIAQLTPGRQEMIREVVVDAIRRGSLPAGNRRALVAASGSTEIADVLEKALAERHARIPARPETAAPDDLTGAAHA
jgi:hypothetical protein